MPQAFIQMEWLGEGWVGRVEAMDRHLNSRAVNIRAASFDECLIMVGDAFHEITDPPPMPPEIKEAIARASDADYDLPAVPDMNVPGGRRIFHVDK